MKKTGFKRFLSLFLTAVLLCGLCVPSDIVRAEGDLLAHYEFQDGGRDSSGNHNDAVIGSGVTVKDGVASLPGGDASGTAFITLPEGMFDKQDNLTIAMWLRDKDPREAWLGAFFFGTPANANNVPENYYYFVPCEKQHDTLKSVFTDSVNSSAPNQTEVGVRESVNTAGYQGVWTHYAIVLQPGSMVCYINGEEVGRKALTRTVSDFGTGLQAYIGKSNYADPLYQGDFKDFRIYKTALDAARIRELVGEIPEPEKEQYSMSIDGNNVTKQLSDTLYGLFYEDINSSADGGLYPEMVKNYSFENAYLSAGSTGSDYFKENGYQTISNPKLHWTASPEANFVVESSEGLNENNTQYAVLTGEVTLENGGFAPKNDPNSAAMAIKPRDAETHAGEYTFSAFTKAPAGYSGKLKVMLADAQGNAITDTCEISLEADGNWKKVSGELHSNVSVNTKGKLVLTAEGANGDEKLAIDMISVVPHDSHGYGNPNYACGVGIRQDLLDKMMALNPKFMRFPGGCIVEGFNWEGLYDWRDTIGPLEQRKSNTNRWENWGNGDHSWGYMQSFGFGYHELLSLCEEYGMEPFPVMSAGLLCQWETGELSGHVVRAKTGEELQRFIDMATNLLDYCWGNPDTNEWAARRRDNGHPAPFNLKYLGIGNENFGNRYFDNLDVIKDAVEDYAAKNYPGHELTIISSAGYKSDGSELEYAYDRLAQTMPGETLVDEHYYDTESFMYNQSDRYDYYQRTEQGGSNIFVGEYAVKNDNKYNTALAEACYITGLERNADVVTNISYAPLLYKVGNENWNHDLIYFDEFDTGATTNYYVQKMFSNNYGTSLIGTKLKSNEKDYSNYGSPLLGTSSAEGFIDKVTIYDKAGNVLLTDDFNDNSNGWASFSATQGANTFTISNGALNFKGTDGINAVYLPKAITEKWTEFKVVAEGVIKEGGPGGFVTGAGHDRQYYWYHMGKNSNSAICMEVTRPERGKTSMTRKVLGNNYRNMHYNTQDMVQVQNYAPMDITFNYGVGGKLEASYQSKTVSDDKTGTYSFSSGLNEYQTDIYQVVNMDQENLYIKLVNPDAAEKEIRLDFSNLQFAGAPEITSLTGGLNDANAIGNEIVVPVTQEGIIENDSMSYILGGQSVNVIRIPLAQNLPKPTATPKPTPTSAPIKLPQKGTSVKVGGYQYKVTASTASKKTVTLTKPAKKARAKVTVPASVKIKGYTYKVTAIGAKAFAGQKKLKNVVIGKNVKTIGSSCFSGCKALQSIVIGKSVKSIGKSCFYNCKNLKKITVKSTVLNKVGKKAFKGIHKKAKISVPKKKWADYKKRLSNKGQAKTVRIVK